jgi:hypoxanthine phosphoribosyltransferase
MQVLVSAEAIQTRVRQLGATLEERLASQQFVMIGVLDGAFIFLADLVRSISLAHRMGFVSASSYRGAVTEAAELLVSTKGMPDVSGLTVVLVDDIFDTGKTLERLKHQLHAAGAAQVVTVVLLWKTGRRTVDLTPDYYGFEIPDQFVVGYGLDFDEQYRHLPDICVLNAELPAD